MDFYRPPTTQGTLAALGSIYRAVRASMFYPKGHPSRRSSLTVAHLAMQQSLNGHTLSLVCGRTGFSFPDGEVLKDTSGLSSALAYELFVRRVKKITFFHDLFLEDLLELCRILCLSPEVIQQSGGIDTMMASRGIRSIWVNEFDLTAIREKRRKVEQAGTIPQGIDEAESGDDGAAPVLEQLSHPQDTLPPEHQLQALLGRLASCDDENIYPRLVNQAVDCADNFKSRHEALLLLPLLELFAAHSCDEARDRKMRDCVQFALEQIVINSELLQIVIERTGAVNGVSKKALYAVLKAGGAVAVTSAIEFMGRTDSLKARKTISTMLGTLGEAAVPALLNLMNDSRWFIIRNICVILGAIASREGLEALKMSLHHIDLRVKKEAIRSLAQLGGNEAESAIIGILNGSDAALYSQAITSLGAMKSRRSLVELMKILFSRDLFLKSLPLKIDALAAIASIGDRQATPLLAKLLEERHLLAAARGRQLKTAVAVCLGRLGDARAVPVLERLVSGGGILGYACSDAIVMIEKTEGNPDAIS